MTTTSGGIRTGAVDADRYGSALTTGDFNSDVRDELAVGIPDDTVGSASGAGTLEVLYGSPVGLGRRSGFDDLWHQDRSDVAGAAEPGDKFGTTLAAGDFDGDGFADLAVGSPYEDIAETNAGAVNVLYGSEDGITATDNHILYQGYLVCRALPRQMISSASAGCDSSVAAALPRRLRGRRRQEVVGHDALSRRARIGTGRSEASASMALLTMG